VRQAYFEAVTLQRRIEILTELVKLAQRTVENAEKLRQAKEVAELDVIQLEVDLERYRAELEASERALPGALRKLAASVGVENMPIGRLIGDLDAQAPVYNLERVRSYILGIHPELRSAQIGVERARLVLRRAEVEPIPNVTVGSGYTYQGQNRSNDWDVGLNVPVPVWNRNQGNIHAARARVSESVSEVSRVENELVGRLAEAYRNYAAASTRAQRYRTAILPKAQRTYELSLKGYQGGQFEYLRVLQAQRAMVEANLELVRALGEMWQAGSEIAGLMLEDQWPLPAGKPAAAERLP
jgi:cobalt-zinc-cadmium efflux system outer membrane protein